MSLRIGARADPITKTPQQVDGSTKTGPRWRSTLRGAMGRSRPLADSRSTVLSVKGLPVLSAATLGPLRSMDHAMSQDASSEPDLLSRISDLRAELDRIIDLEVSRLRKLMSTQMSGLEHEVSMALDESSRSSSRPALAADDEGRRSREPLPTFEPPPRPTPSSPRAYDPEPDCREPRGEDTADDPRKRLDALAERLEGRLRRRRERGDDRGAPTDQ